MQCTRDDVHVKFWPTLENHVVQKRMLESICLKGFSYPDCPWLAERSQDCLCRAHADLAGVLGLAVGIQQRPPISRSISKSNAAI